MSELLGCGIYVIINKKVNVVYVGQTQKNFLIRWLEHLRRIEKYEDDLHRLQLYLDGNTKYLIAKKMDGTNDLLDFYKFEKEAIEFYKNRNWIVVSELTERKTGGEMSESGSVKRYKEMIRHMVLFLGSVDVKENYVGKLYGQIYRKIDKSFHTDVRKRSEGKKVIDVLTAEELESVLLDLYPRYESKKVAVERKKYKEWF